MTGAIFWETRPAMIIRSDWRGEPRKTSAPKREISKREALIDIISMAQHARPKVIGQMEDLRAQLTAMSSVVNRTPSASMTPSYQIPPDTGILKPLAPHAQDHRNREAERLGRRHAGPGDRDPLPAPGGSIFFRRQPL